MIRLPGDRQRERDKHVEQAAINKYGDRINWCVHGLKICATAGNIDSYAYLHAQLQQVLSEHRRYADKLRSFQPQKPKRKRRIKT